MKRILMLFVVMAFMVSLTACNSPVVFTSTAENLAITVGSQVAGYGFAKKYPALEPTALITAQNLLTQSQTEDVGTFLAATLPLAINVALADEKDQTIVGAVNLMVMDITQIVKLNLGSSGSVTMVQIRAAINGFIQGLQLATPGVVVKPTPVVSVPAAVLPTVPAAK